MGKSSGHLPAHFEDPQADTWPAQQALPAGMPPSSCIPGMASPTTSTVPVAPPVQHPAPSWSSQALVICSLPSPALLKKERKQNCFPAGCRQEMQVQAAQS